MNDKLKNLTMLKGNRGFALVGVLAISAIITGLSYSVISMINNQTSFTKKRENTTLIKELHFEVEKFVNHGANCTDNFSVAFPGFIDFDLVEIKDNLLGGLMSYKVAAAGIPTYKSGKIQIDKISIKNFVVDMQDLSSGIAEMVIMYSYLFKAERIKLNRSTKIKITLAKDNFGNILEQIESCRIYDKAFSFWKRNVDGSIYYDKKVAGGGLSEPFYGLHWKADPYGNASKNFIFGVLDRPAIQIKVDNLTVFSVLQYTDISKPLEMAKNDQNFVRLQTNNLYPPVQVASKDAGGGLGIGYRYGSTLPANTQILSNDNLPNIVFRQNEATSNLDWTMQMDAVSNLVISRKDGGGFLHISYDDVQINSVSRPGLNYVFYVGGSVSSLVSPVCASDRRLKSNIKNLKNNLDKIMKLNGYTYQLKSQKNQDTHIGLMADELLKVFPQIVDGGNLGHYTVDYDMMTAPLAGAIKELSRRQKKLEDSLDSDLKQY